MSSRPPSAPGTLDVGQVIDSSDVLPLHWGIFTLCALCMIMDGFDVQALGYAVPSITREWNISPALFASVFGFTNLGVLIGQLSFTMLADRVGRRPVLLVGTLTFAVLVILTGLTSTITQLKVMRLLAGMALGSIIPNATALFSELVPKKARIRLLTWMGLGFTAGAAIAGFVANWLIPTFGWRSVFYFGGIAPLIIAAVMFVWLPESLTFLVMKNRKDDYVRTWLQRLSPGTALTPATRLIVHEESRQGMPVMHLFRDGRGLVTIMMWVVFFMNLFNLYSLASWIPTVATASGNGRWAILLGTTLQVGGTVSPFLLAWLVMQFGFVPMLTVTFLIAAGAIAMIGQSGLTLVLLFSVVFIAGACIVGSQPSLNALAATYYPTYLRSTGVGWALGIGRAGSIVGPVMTGQFIALKWTPHDIFLALSIPAMISAVFIFALQFAMGSSTAARPHAEAMASGH